MSELMVDNVALCPQQQVMLQALTGARTFGEATGERVLDIRGSLDLARLQRALAALPGLHPVLSARLRQVAGFHGLRLCPDAEATPVPLEAEAAVLTPSAAQQRLEAWRQRPFSMVHGPWAGALLSTLGEGHWRLTLAVANGLVDGPSLALLADSLATLYQVPDSQPAEDAPRFEQYLEWRAETALDEDAPEADRYWRNHLQGDQAASATLPYRLGEAQGLRAERVRIPLAPALQDELARKAAVLAMAPAQVLQAAWWALLSRVSGQSALLGTWHHDSREDYDYFAPCAGVLEKALPVNLRVDEAQPFDAWATEFSAVLAQHVVWQEYWPAPLGGARPAFAFATLRDAAGTPAGWHIDQTPQLQGSELLLQVHMAANGTCQALLLDFLPGCYCAASAERLLEQYVALLQHVLSQPGTTIGQLNLVGEAEQARVLALNPVAPNEPAQLLTQRLQQWLAQTPGVAAIVCAEQRLSYGQLAQRAQALAAHLAEQGIQPGMVVAIALPRCNDLLVSILATWWLGATYLPLDPQWPVARQLQVAAQAGVTTIVGQLANAHELLASGLKVLDPGLVGSDAAGTYPAAYPLQGHEAAYVLFTSGSTGVPKGVVIEHRHLANYLAGASQALGLESCAQFGFTSGVAADLGNTTLFGALYNGACLQVADEETMRVPERFAAYLAESNIDCLKIVPSHLAALLEAEHPRLPATLILGGEPPAPSLIQRIFQVRADCRLFNHYGPTEATVGVMVQALTPAAAQQPVIPLGQVLAGNQVYVLDAQQRLLPVGVLGELYIGGLQVCRGYLQPATEHQVFVDHPFAPGQRLYRTGDLARYRADGTLTLHGRKDQQVKLNGFRVELGELEAELLRLPMVREVVVIAVPADEGQSGLQPAAFVVVQAGEAEPIQRIRLELAERLPTALLPRRIQLVAQLPRLANGKVDRRALGLLGPVAEDAPCDPPRNAFEELLAKRMARLLGKEVLGIHQDFFVAGGHSLLAIKLVAGIRKVLRCDISPAVIFDNPTVAGLAQALGELPGADAQKLEATARAYLQLEALPPEQRAQLEEKARRLREFQG
ncbi:non-ribosomal peptide synthetase [Pseudomonas abieticivorans]|uniref:non-ribosomal peptide synthetase n=1 Tax=Pseudomonas abieticivorans TaxID=2931382 RepID=UPI0020BDBF33|nr:amino acid adenylation domain-containing protein [Pseudomonas sp. PIA16]